MKHQSSSISDHRTPISTSVYREGRNHGDISCWLCLLALLSSVTTPCNGPLFRVSVWWSHLQVVWGDVGVARCDNLCRMSARQTQILNCSFPSHHKTTCCLEGSLLLSLGLTSGSSRGHPVDLRWRLMMKHNYVLVKGSRLACMIHIHVNTWRPSCVSSSCSRTGARLYTVCHEKRVPHTCMCCRAQIYTVWVLPHVCHVLGSDSHSRHHVCWATQGIQGYIMCWVSHSLNLSLYLSLSLPFLLTLSLSLSACPPSPSLYVYLLHPVIRFYLVW